MDERDRRKLRRLRVTLVKDLDPKALYDYLVSREIFTDDMVEDLETIRTRRERASKMLMELERRGSRALPVFIEALDESKQSHLADIIREALASDNVDAQRRDAPALPAVCRSVPSGDFKPNGAALSRDASREYPMQKSPRGKCLIINNVAFRKLAERVGSEVDCASIADVFTNNFHLDVAVTENLSKQEMLGALKSLAADDHTNADCCVIVIMSHGREIEHRRFPGAVYGTDDLFVRMEEIVSYFSGNDCPSLLGKPKVFFIQACGGEDKDRGALFSTEGDGDGDGDQDDDEAASTADAGAVSEEASASDEETDATPVFAEPGRNAAETDATPHLPSMSDMLVAYSSLPGFVSWRDRKQGSWFIQVMLEVFKKHAVNEDLVSMITMVNDKLSEEYQAKGAFKQTSSPLNTLRKRLYFNPTF